MYRYYITFFWTRLRQLTSVYYIFCWHYKYRNITKKKYQFFRNISKINCAFNIKFTKLLGRRARMNAVYDINGLTNASHANVIADTPTFIPGAFRCWVWKVEIKSSHPVFTIFRGPCTLPVTLVGKLTILIFKY